MNKTIPCDVMLPPSTIIKRGCSLNTLLIAMEQREKFPEEAQVFGRKELAGLPQAQDEREAFEAEARKLLYVLEREAISGEYIVPDTENAWKLWQARATRTEQQPVAVVKENNHCPEGLSDEISEHLPHGTKLYAAPIAQDEREAVEVVAVVKHDSPLPGYTEFMKYEQWMADGLSGGWEKLMTVAQHQSILSAVSAERDALRELAYVGEHMHEDCSWKARHAELRAEVDELRAESTESAGDRIINGFVILDGMAFSKMEILEQRIALCDALDIAEKLTAEHDQLRALIAECVEYLNTDHETSISSGSVLHRKLAAALSAQGGEG